MKIVKRHKNENGLVYGYTLADDNGKEAFLNKDVVIKLFGSITNAYLCKNGEFRANNGESIDTVVDTKSLSVVKKTEVIDIKGCDVITEPYYGKDYINICKRIRRYTIEGKIHVSSEKHKSNNGKNTHLFKLIEACGVSITSFIKGYLSVLQPYSLSKFQGTRDIGKSSLWLCDVGYGISLVIKINETDKNKPIVVSFHESNINGKFSKGGKDFSDKPCAVFVQNARLVEDGLYYVSYHVQRGFLRYTVCSYTSSYRDSLALVKYEDIVKVFDKVVDSILDNMVEVYLDKSVDEVQSFTLGGRDYSKLSFMSLGYATANNICLMIDLYSQCRNNKERSTLVELATNIISEMSDIRLEEIKLALSDRYDGSSNKLYLAIKEL